MHLLGLLERPLELPQAFVGENHSTAETVCVRRSNPPGEFKKRSHEDKMNRLGRLLKGGSHPMAVAKSSRRGEDSENPERRLHANRHDQNSTPDQRLMDGEIVILRLLIRAL